VASLEDVDKSRRAVQEFYGSRGYMRTRVQVIQDPDPAASLVDLRFLVEEGQLAYIRDIRIRGNTRTQDKVVRRELTVYPGDVYNEVKIQRSQSRVRNLGYFSYVNSSPAPTAAPDRYDLIFDVEEQKTGQFVVGAGFSSIDQLVGFVELSQGNFDLGGWPHFSGGGQKVKVRAQFGTQRNDFEFSFIEPWFLNRRLSLGVSLFQNDRRFLSDEYDQVNTGGSISLGRAIGGRNRLNLTYRLEQVEISDVSTNASELIRIEEGDQVKSSLSLTLIHDTRNAPFVPTKGGRTSVSGTLAGGPLSFDTDLYGLTGRTSYYFPLWLNHILIARGRAEVVEAYGSSDRVPIFDRLFLGGARTLRGFDYREVGPKDEQGEAVGGKTLGFGSLEYAIPLAEKVRVAGFYDAGFVNEESFEFDPGAYNSNYGVGLRLDIPQFPLQIDYAWPLEADEFNDRTSGRFSFLLGYTL
jgi:outer membrane protein insertion porin family